MKDSFSSVVSSGIAKYSSDTLRVCVRDVLTHTIAFRANRWSTDCGRDVLLGPDNFDHPFGCLSYCLHGQVVKKGETDKRDRDAQRGYRTCG